MSVMGQSLPVWISWIQALGLPVVGAIIAGSGVFIAYQQKRLADIRLQHDLYDRRFAVYEATKAFIIGAVDDDRMTAKLYLTFKRGTSQNVFLFDATLAAYLSEIDRRALELFRIHRRLDEGRLDEEARIGCIDEAAAITTWFSEQFDPLTTNFAPFLRLGEHRRRG